MSPNQNARLALMAALRTSLGSRVSAGFWCGFLVQPSMPRFGRPGDNWLNASPTSSGHRFRIEQAGATQKTSQCRDLRWRWRVQAMHLRFRSCVTGSGYARSAVRRLASPLRFCGSPRWQSPLEAERFFYQKRSTIPYPD